MKFTLSWLKEHVDTDVPVGELTDRLSLIGLEEEGVEDRAAGLEPFVVGHIVEASPHPDADRLQVCKVDIGAAELLQIVCGAPNARVGLKSVLAPLGTVIPGNGMKLKPTKIRGVDSEGMLCSGSEIGIEDGRDGIMELAEDAAPGASIIGLLGLDDAVIDLNVTPNRGDCLGVRGVAREVAAAGMGTLKPLVVLAIKGEGACPVEVVLDFPEDAKDACPMFAGRVIKGVKNGESPQWLQDRLRAVGLRPISALVDVTNFFTLDRCRPLHVFDAAKISGALRLHLSEGGESLAALDDKTYTLTPGMTLISDESGAQSLGGVIGGAPTGVSEETTEVFLECAHFDPIRTAMTGRQLKIESDARYRFERGVDPSSVLEGIEAATAMILEICGGEASELVVAGGEPEWRRALTLRADRVETLGGLSLPLSEVQRILESLGATVTPSEVGLSVTPPPWRKDIEGEADLVEEVLRIYGYDAIPTTPLTRDTTLPLPALTASMKRASKVRRALAGRGIIEAVTWSFMDGELATPFNVPGSAPVVIANPISANLNVMRPSILPNLLQGIGKNQDRGFHDVSLFEVGPQFSGDEPKDQRLVASGVRAGSVGGRHWLEKARAVDIFDVKADALEVFAACGFDASKVQVSTQTPSYYHPGRSGRFQLGPKKVLGYFGELHPSVLKALDVRGRAVAFEVFLGAIPTPKKKSKSVARPLLKRSSFQAVQRDFAFVLDREVSADSLVRAALRADNKLIESVEIFDLYEGEHVEGDRKSLAITVKLQPWKGTLTDEDIEQVSRKIIQLVEKKTGGVLRG